jgi:ABC-2 type transport system permease protein
MSIVEQTMEPRGPTPEMPETVRRSELRNSLRRIWAVYIRHAYSLKHSLPGVFDMLFWPAMDLLLWGLLTVFITSQNVDLPVAVGFLIGGVLLWDIVFRSNLGIGITFLDDTSWTHNVLNLLVSPLRPSEYIAGAVAWSLSKVLAGWAIMLTIAWLLFGFSALDLGLPLVFFVLALMIFGTAIGMIVLGIILRFGPGADIMAWGLAVLMMPISAVFYPVDVLPGWAQVIARGLPTSYVFEGMRAILAGKPAPWGNLGIAFAIDAVYLVAGLAFARSMFGVLRRRGYVTRYME